MFRIGGDKGIFALTMYISSRLEYLMLCPSIPYKTKMMSWIRSDSLRSIDGLPLLVI